MGEADINGIVFFAQHPGFSDGDRHAGNVPFPAEVIYKSGQIQGVFFLAVLAELIVVALVPSQSRCGRWVDLPCSEAQLLLGKRIRRCGH